MRQVPPFIEGVLQEHYGIKGRIRSLPGELDLNFDVETDDSRYVFKVMRLGCTAEFVDLQVKAMEHVRKRGLAQYIPAVVCTTNNKSYISAMDADGHNRLAWLISFLPGTLLTNIEPWTLQLANNIGRVLGHLSNALKAFDHPLLDRPLKWDLRQAGWIDAHLGAFEEACRRKTVGAIATRFTDEISPLLETLPRVPIYGDANDMNILVKATNDRPNEVAGIIDFGDMIRTPRVCEPAIAMAYVMMGDGDPIARGAALASGFHAVSPLNKAEISLLLPLVKLRLAVSVTNAVVESRRHPGNEYLSISEAPAWHLLDQLSALKERSATAPILSACVAAKVHRAARDSSTEQLRARRRRVTPSNQVLSYDTPLHLVRGKKHFVYHADGSEYLDAYNNVPHVGHAHPVVNDAVTKQLSLLNTNTRYLQDVHVDYAEAMLALLPDQLSKIIFLNSASEANELALRLVRAATGARDMLVMDHGYHGGTTGAMDISPYKFNHAKGTRTPPDWVHVTLQPDCYRGQYRGPDVTSRFISNIDNMLDDLAAKKRPLAGFISECLPSVGGQIVLPDGYLKAVYKMVRAGGGVCIADDVQTALGRLGEFFWGFEQQDAVPDIAVFGKPLGNGYPLAAVAMTEEISNAFTAGPEFFSTFGGSSAACAAGNAVLDVLAAEKLPTNAHNVGAITLAELRSLARQYEIIGEVRGSGFFLGVDLVTDREERSAAAAQAAYIKNRMAEERVLIGVEGPDNNVLKIRPPMTFDEAAADRLLSTLDGILSERGARV